MRVEQYGKNITKERYEQATDEQQFVFEVCWEMWDPRSVIPMEIGDWYTSELKEDKDIHTVLDCSCAIDYLVDPFTQTPFGLNHRVHTPTNKALRFDIRAKNDNNATSELNKLLNSAGSNDIVPKYATRMKLDHDGIEWFRIVHLKPLIDAINVGLTPEDKYSGEDYTAWFFNYDLLKSMDCLVAEFDSSMSEVFADESHKSLEGYKP